MKKDTALLVLVNPEFREGACRAGTEIFEHGTHHGAAGIPGNPVRVVL
jgi:hypothetical protein